KLMRDEPGAGEQRVTIELALDPGEAQDGQWRTLAVEKVRAGLQPPTDLGLRRRAGRLDGDDFQPVRQRRPGVLVPAPDALEQRGAQRLNNICVDGRDLTGCIH